MPYISQNFINDLPNQIDIVDLISKRLTLKKMGSGYRAPCPFHGGKNPNFSVNSHEQFYHCFKCGESGGAISFVQKYEKLNFVEAIEMIAEEFNLSIEYDSNSKPVDPKLEQYRELSRSVADFYIQQLKTSPAKKRAINYAKNRGINSEIAKNFELGFATPSNKDLLLAFEKNERSTANLKALGLVKTGEYGDYDFFRDRLIFPIHNSKGKIIAFGGRAFDNTVKAKYLNSQESPIFSKSKELYGLYHARKYSSVMDYIMVVEGYMDVIALHQAGITKVVATLGTATTEQHLQTLSRTTNNIVFCFDGDDAGRGAAWKALKIALPMIKSGLLIKFLFLPNDEDPDTLIKKESVQAFEKRIDEAHPLSKFLFNHIQVSVDFDTIEGKTLFLEKVLALIATVTHDAYQQQLLEGVAQFVGQGIEQIKTIFSQQVKKVQSKVQMKAPIQASPDMKYAPILDFTEEYIDSTVAPQQHHSIKVLMGKMINLLLNYPTLANNDIEKKVRNIEKSQVLLDLVHSAEMDEEISQENLIKPFKSKPGIYQRLQKLCTLDPFLDENQARNEFLFALTKAEKYQNKTKIKNSIANANTLDQQQKVMKAIAKNKSNTIFKK